MEAVSEVNVIPTFQVSVLDYAQRFGDEVMAEWMFNWLGEDGYQGRVTTQVGV